ncbi:mandelate racemase/muconate lactonizing enzyme family protein [Bosea sp. BK604]|uniref:mandelate racemase/muconate lactonizing enzyme family protein n=1 Tax=Bosea sp. BK604 TaxID=2512180 RepID=UPI001044E9AF|nr:mandelate racemase/muconate lactonizing enzyme family protein [Bosea sp. BK604]TCR64625.1 L-alanine-DL-glutamate epimerase-like enolase superfamily enzyme [Bosea sp. BK604]
MKIARVQAYHLTNIPITPPPFRKLPNVEQAIMVEIETDDGLVGWAMGGYAHPIIVNFINRYVQPVLIGEDPVLIERINYKLWKQFIFAHRDLGRSLVSGLAMIDIALWDIKGKACGRSVHHLIGGAFDKIPVYITHGAAYGGAPVYSVEELAAESKHLVALGNTHLKNTVGRQTVPDPDDDYIRMKAMRDAVGPNVKIAMDGNARMTAIQAIRLCEMCRDLDIAFFEEPLLDNDPRLMLELKAKTSIPMAIAENAKYSIRDQLIAGAVDIVQPNVNNDGGYTAGIRIAGMAKAFNKPISHGNGAGPHNVALQAGLMNGTLVEYHFHKWMAYNAIFEEVPQPVDGFLHVSTRPGTGLWPKDGLIKEFNTPV